MWQLHGLLIAWRNASKAPEVIGVERKKIRQAVGHDPGSNIRIVYLNLASA